VNYPSSDVERVPRWSGWPSIEEKLVAGLLLLNGLYKLEENFILEKENIYLADLR
jgi:hypothetical protein